MYYYLLRVVDGSQMQATLTARTLTLSDGPMRIHESIRIVREESMLRLAANRLRLPRTMGITIRKVAGQVQMGTVERILIEGRAP